jgi:hypothetical protein
MSARPVDDILTIVESSLVINLYSEIDHHLVMFLHEEI